MTWHGRILDVLRARGLTVAAGEHYLIAQCDHATLAAALREAGVMVDALIVDAPYSERTHAGHDGGAASANKLADGEPVGNQRRYALGLPPVRREIPYAAWGRSDVESFVGDWHALVRGWVCSLTDHALAPLWSASMEAAYRYVFSPLACVEPGSRVRLTGDGPSQWSTWLVVSRPRVAEWARWGTLPGAYVVAAGTGDARAGRRADGSAARVPGGKPPSLMRAIVGDYSAPGDIVCDPCMGAGTTLVAAVELGRRAIGCEPDAGRFEMAAKRLAKTRPQLRMRLDVDATMGEQSALALGGE